MRNLHDFESGHQSAFRKPAGVRCVQLTDDNRCKLFNHPDRPAVCVALRPNLEMCGQTADEAMTYLIRL